MVYTGSPSKGCDSCRLRRVKCDEQTPECSNCLKTKRKCPGYTGKLVLAARQEKNSRLAESKKKLVASPVASGSEPCTSTSVAVSNPAITQVKSPSYAYTESIPYLLENDHWERALTFFFSTYARQTTSENETRGFLEHVIPLYHQAAPQSTMRFSTLALATFMLGAWSNETMESPISRGCYTKALESMKQQLISPTNCSNDEMLISILLLQLYETIVGTVKRTNSSRAHVQGAMAVVKHRGASSFNTKTSHGLLLCVRNELIQECLKTKTSIDPEIFTWGDILPESQLSPSQKLEGIVLDLVNLQADHSTSLTSKSSTAIGGVYNRAMAIEQRLNTWFAGIPEPWRPIRISSRIVPESVVQAGMYKEYCDVYRNLTVTWVINKYRVAYLRTRAVILSCLTQQSRTLNSLRMQAESLNKIQTCADDVCASVPFHLGDQIIPGYLDVNKIRYPQIPGQNLPEGHRQMGQARGGWQLLDALPYLLGMQAKLRPGQREWIGGQLVRIAKLYNFDR